jgi:hypothetical protein
MEMRVSQIPTDKQRPDLIGRSQHNALRARNFLQHLRVRRSGVGIVRQSWPQYAARTRLSGLGFQLVQEFHITEKIKLEFRSEFFNVFNHPNLQFAKSGPQNSINTTTFGTPVFGFLTAARDPRQIQFALKLSF